MCFLLYLQVNLSIEGAKGPVDPWHYDSVAYTGVVLLSDISKMKGGALEIMNHNKHEAIDLLAEGKPHKTEVVGYERPGVISQFSIFLDFSKFKFLNASHSKLAFVSL